MFDYITLGLETRIAEKILKQNPRSMLCGAEKA